MNDTQIIRKAVLELQSLDDKNVVKVAGILRRIKNWWEAFKNPQYKEQVEKLQQESSDVKELIDALGQSINELQSAISSNDVELYGRALERVRTYASRLVGQVSTYERSAEVAHTMAPEKIVNVPTERELQNVTRDMLKDPDVLTRLKKQLPDEYDIPVGRIGQPAQNYNWMKQFGTQDVQFMPGPVNRITTDLAAAVARYLELDESEAISVVNADRAKLLENMAAAILNGRINRVDFASVSDQITHRPANQMKMYMSAYNIPIPGTSIMFDLPNVVMVDLMASGKPSKKLSVYYADHIRISSPTAMAKQERFNKLLKLAQNNVHQWARGILQQAFKQVMGREPTLAELQLAQAVSWHESNYGHGWRADKSPDGRASSSNNWGAVQCCMPKDGVCPGNSFMYTDTHPTSQGVNVRYAVCFKTYPTPVDGAADVVKLLFKTKARGSGIQQAAQQGSVGDFSKVMYDTHYYEGWGKTREERIAGHANRMRKTIQMISGSLGEQPQFADIDSKQKATDVMLPHDKMFTAKPQESDEPQQLQEAVMDEYNKLMPMLFANDCGPVERLVRKGLERKALPRTNLFIRLNGETASFPSMVRFARILTSAIRDELDGESSIFHNGSMIEIETCIHGTPTTVLKAATALTDGILADFKQVTNGITIKSEIHTDIKSSYKLLDSGTSEECFRKFAFEMMARGK